MTESANALIRRFEDEVTNLEVEFILPAQRDMFLCSAQCCSTESSMPVTQGCLAKCQFHFEHPKQIMGEQIGSFSQRFSRCGKRCEDIAENLAADKPMSAVTQAYEKCLDKCAVEFQKMLPKFMHSVRATLKGLHD